MARHDFLRAVVVAALTLASASLTRAAQSSSARPNILIAVADDLGYGDLACYGHRLIQTPNIDHFAAQGVKLTDYYSPAPLCSPARAGFLTGRNPYRCGIYDWIPDNWPVYLRREEITFATLLKGVGYDTCQIGKWHLNGKLGSPEQPQPNDHGFDYWFSTLHNAEPSHHNPENFYRNGKPVGRLEGYAADLCVQETINWLQNKWDRSKPFCIFLCFHEPHKNIATDPEIIEQYYSDERLQYQYEISPAEYFGNVTQLDRAYGRLMKTLDAMKLTNNTFTMFASDNGPDPTGTVYGSAGQMRRGKAYIYEGGIRVPCLVRWPGHIKPGVVSEEPSSGMDLLPTLCQIAGAKVPEDRTIDGVSMLPMFTGERLEREIPMYFRWNGSWSDMKIAMREGDWKLLADSGLKNFEMYNLRADPRELHNAAGLRPMAKFEELKSKLRKLHEGVTEDMPKNWHWGPPATNAEGE